MWLQLIHLHLIIVALLGYQSGYCSIVQVVTAIELGITEIFCQLNTPYVKAFLSCNIMHNCDILNKKPTTSTNFAPPAGQNKLSSSQYPIVETHITKKMAIHLLASGWEHLNCLHMQNRCLGKLSNFSRETLHWDCLSAKVTEHAG